MQSQRHPTRGRKRTWTDEGDGDPDSCDGSAAGPSQEDMLLESGSAEDIGFDAPESSRPGPKDVAETLQ